MNRVCLIENPILIRDMLFHFLLSVVQNLPTQWLFCAQTLFNLLFSFFFIENNDIKLDV